MRKTTTSTRFELVGEKLLKDNEVNKELQFNSKSDMMRYLYDNKMSVADIQRFLNCHYSFVYGVISSSREIIKNTEKSKSDIIREMSAQGKTVGQIAKELNSNYSFVFSVVKKYKSQSKEA